MAIHDVTCSLQTEALGWILTCCSADAGAVVSLAMGSADACRCNGDGWLAISKRAAAALDLVGFTGSTLPPRGSSPADLTAVAVNAAEPLLPGQTHTV